MDDGRHRETALPLPLDEANVFASLPGHHVVIAPGSTIAAASDAFIGASSAHLGDDPLGRDLFDVLSHRPFSFCEEARQTLRISLEGVRRSREPNTVVLHPCDSERDSHALFWRVSSAPLARTNGEEGAAAVVMSLEGAAMQAPTPTVATRRDLEALRERDAAQSQSADHKRAVEALRESERRFRLLLDSTAEAIYGLDVDGRCTFVNTACLRQLGYDSAEELLHRDMHALIHHTLPDGTPHAKDACRIYQAFRNGEVVHEQDELLWRKDGSSFRAEYRSHPMRQGEEIVGAVVSFLDVSDRLRAEEAARKLSLERIIAASTEAERRRLGRELHDGLRQQLLSMKILATSLHRRFASQSLPEADLLQDFVDLLADANYQVREIINGLAPRKIEPDHLVGALERAARNLEQWYEMGFRVRSHEPVHVQDAYTADHLFHIAHEAMTNAAKHSSGSRVDVDLWTEGGTLVLRVRDDGVGLSDGDQHNGGMGLINQRHRAELIHAELQIECENGTVVTCRLAGPSR